MRSSLLNQQGKGASILTWLVYGAVCALLGMVLSSYAYSGKIWTNAADGTPDSGITEDAYGNWALIAAASGNGLLFDGVNDQVNIADHVDLRLGTGDFTVIAWIKPDNIVQDAGILKKSETSGNYAGWTVGITGADAWFNSTGKKIACLFRKDGSNEYGVYTTNDVVDGNWHHIAVVGTASSKTFTIYVDGSSVATTVSHAIGTWGSADGTNPSAIIGSNEGSGPGTYKGTIGEVRVYNTALSSGTISTDYNSGSGTQCTGSETGIKGCWKFNETTGTSAADSAGTAQNGTLVNFPASPWQVGNSMPPWGYPANSPVVTFTELDLGYNATFDMSGFRATEVLTTGSVKYQYRSHATSCASGTWNGTWLTRTQMQAVSDISSVECIQFKAQLNSDGLQSARVDHVTIPYSPYNTVSTEVVDTFIESNAANNNFGASTTGTVGYSASQTGNYLIKLNDHLIPRETINSVTLYLYLSPSTWATSENLRVYRLKDGVANVGNFWKEGTKNNVAGTTGETTWNKRRCCTGDSGFDNANWVGSAGAETSVSDYYANSFTPNNPGTYTNMPDPPTTDIGCKLSAGGNRCANFDGSNDIISIPNAESLNTNGGSFTVLSWVKPVNIAQNTDIFNTLGLVGGEYVGLTLGVTGANSHFGGTGKKIACLFRDSNAVERGVYTTSDVVDGNWHHVVCVGNGSTLAIYVDGSAATITSDWTVGSWPNGNNGLPSYIGSAETATYNGLIDEVRFYNTALSSGDISTDYATGTGTQCTGSETGLISCWRLNDSSGTTAIDSQTGDTSGDTPVSLNLGASFTAGYYPITIPLQWVRDWRDKGENRGLLIRTESRTGTHTLTLSSSENGTNPAYFKIDYTLDAVEPTTSRVINGEGYGYANFWAGNWHGVYDSQGNHIVIVSKEDGNVGIYKYSDDVWDEITTLPSGYGNRVGVILKDSNNYFHYLNSNSASTVIYHYISTYSDDLSVWNSAISFGPTSCLLFDKGTSVIDSNDKIHSFVGRCGQYNSEYWTKTPSGSWTYISDLHATANNLWYGSRAPWYINVWVDGTNLYMVYNRSLLSGEYAQVGYMQSLDGGSTWTKSNGTGVTLPISWWDDERIAPSQTNVESHISNTSILKMGSDIYVNHWYRQAGTLGSLYVDNMTGTDNDYSFGGATGKVVISQTFPANDIGKACFKLKKTGVPTQKIAILTVDGETPSTFHITQSNKLILPSDVTTAYQTFCMEFNIRDDTYGDINATRVILGVIGNSDSSGNNYIISTDNANSYASGNLRYYNGSAWTADTAKDLNTQIYLRSADVLYEDARMLKLTGGSWTIPTQHTPKGGYNIAVQTTGGLLFDFMISGYDGSDGALNARYTYSSDGASTWQDMINITTDATIDRQYYYPTRSGGIASAYGDLLFQSMFAFNPGNSEVTDLYFVRLRLIPALTGMFCGFMDILGKDCGIQ